MLVLVIVCRALCWKERCGVTLWGMVGRRVAERQISLALVCSHPKHAGAVPDGASAFYPQIAKRRISKILKTGVVQKPKKEAADVVSHAVLVVLYDHWSLCFSFSVSFSDFLLCFFSLFPGNITVLNKYFSTTLRKFGVDVWFYFGMVLK